MQFREKIQNAHSFWRVLIWLGLTVVAFVLLEVGYGLYAWLTGDASSVGAMRMLTFLQFAVVFALPAWLAVRCWSRKPFGWLRMDRLADWRLFALTFLLMIVAQPGINIIGTWNEQLRLPACLEGLEQLMQQMEEQAQALTEQLAFSPTVGLLLLNLLVMALSPAIAEEMMFRGVMLGLMDGKNRDSLECRTSAVPARLSRRTHIAIWATGIIFSFIHFQFYGFFPRMLLGVILGYLLCWSGTLWLPILAHFTNNGLVILFGYLELHTNINADSVESFGTGTTAWAGVLSLILTVGLLWLVRSVAQRRSSAPHPEAPAE